MTDGVPDVDLDAVRREGLLPARGVEPAQHDGTGRVDISFRVDTGSDAPPTERNVRVPPGVTVFDAGSWNGIAIDSTCGGHGTCHKCKVRVEGQSPITRHDVRTFTPDQIADGWRLACLVRATRDLRVDVPPLTTRPKAATVGVGRQVILRPAVQKRYVVDGRAFYYRNAQHPGAPIKDVVQVFYQFRNDAPAGLGMPMPAGVIRVYQSDSKGGVQFVGEDRINHTPKDETLNLKIGNAFDVVCERKQTDFEKIATSVYEIEYEITVRNHKSAPITVEVNEPIGGTWRMLQSSHKWTKTEAWASQFVVPVAVDGTSVLRYRVRVTY